MMSGSDSAQAWRRRVESTAVSSIYEDGGEMSTPKTVEEKIKLRFGDKLRQEPSSYELGDIIKLPPQSV
ncbi:hypothetical protein Bca4012_009577 [Brassica carinata]